MEGKRNLKLVGSGKRNNDPHDMSGIEWGSDQFIKKLERAEKDQEHDQHVARVHKAMDQMRSI